VVLDHGDRWAVGKLPAKVVGIERLPPAVDERKKFEAQRMVAGQIAPRLE
jgi:hypothetical protein